jgi:hypothetical protein
MSTNEQTTSGAESTTTATTSQRKLITRGNLRLVVSNDSVNAPMQFKGVSGSARVLQRGEFPKSLASAEAQVIVCNWIADVMAWVFGNTEDHAHILHVPQTQMEGSCIELFIQNHILREVVVDDTSSIFTLLLDNSGSPHASIKVFNCLRDAVIGLIMADVQQLVTFHMNCDFAG